MISRCNKNLSSSGTIEISLQSNPSPPWHSSEYCHSTIGKSSGTFGVTIAGSQSSGFAHPRFRHRATQPATHVSPDPCCTTRHVTSSACVA